MQEPDTMREQGAFQLAKFFPVGYAIKQEEEEPRRVQVRIPEYHTGIDDEDLPWYRVMQHGSSGHNGRTGSYTTISHGTEVIVMVYDARGYNGVIMGWLPNKSNGISNGNQYGWRDEEGNSFDVDVEGNMTLTGADGAIIKLERGNKLTIKAEELDLQIGDFTITAEMLTLLASTFNQTANTWTVSANGPTIQDNGGGSASPPTLTPPTLPDEPDKHSKTEL